MRHYRFYSTAPHGRLAVAHDTQCKDDMNAMMEGGRWADGAAVEIEIWQGNRFVALIKKGHRSPTPDSASIA